MALLLERVGCPPVRGASQHVQLRSTAGVGPLLGAVVAAMRELSFGEGDCFAVRLALGEAVVNAVRHGNRGDPRKLVRVRYRVGPGRFVAEVEDEGPGFDPAAVPDPRAPANRERPGGRGLFLMRHYLTAVRYNGRGNRVRLYQRRST
jgi:serine/threonine-protein kinase RsbW